MSKNLESKILFPITRVVVLIMMIIVIAITAYQLIPKNVFLSTKSYTAISYGDIIERLDLEREKKEDAPAEKEPEFIVPDNIKKYVEKSNIEVLKGWADNINKDKLPEFWSNLDKVVGEGRKNNIEDTIISNTFRDIVFENKNKAEVDARQAAKESVINPMMIMGLLLMFLLLGNLMAILAVERNTRKSN